MFKNKFNLFFLYTFILLIKISSPMPRNLKGDPNKDTLRKSAILEAKLFLNKQKALIETILKRDRPALEIMLEKIKQCENMYGQLTYAEKENLLELINKEIELEKATLHKLTIKDMVPLSKKGTVLISILALEVYLLKNIYLSPSINTLGAFEAICKHLKQTAAWVNIPIIIFFNIWAFLDVLKYNSKASIEELKTMKVSLKL